MVPTLLTLTGDDPRDVAALRSYYDQQVALGIWPWLVKAGLRVAKIGVKVGKKIGKAVKAARKVKRAAKAAKAAVRSGRAAPSRPAPAPSRGSPGRAPGAVMPAAGMRDVLIGAAIVGGVLLLASGRKG